MRKNGYINLNNTCGGAGDIMFISVENKTDKPSSNSGWGNN